jgi:hypothetical protein
MSSVSCPVGHTLDRAHSDCGPPSLLLARHLPARVRFVARASPAGAWGGLQQNVNLVLREPLGDLIAEYPPEQSSHIVHKGYGAAVFHSGRAQDSK